jgi:hypothetical protein
MVAAGGTEERAMAEVRTCEDMRRRIRAQLERQTGCAVEEWHERIGSARRRDEETLRAWCDAHGVTGYRQMLLVWETFGYPDFLLTSADELLEAQYDDRRGLRPVCDAPLAVAAALGHVSVQVRKTYVSLRMPRRTFAVVQASTKRRVDLGLRVSDVAPGGRLAPAKGVGNDAITVRIPLERPDDADDEVARWLGVAYEESQ